MNSMIVVHVRDVVRAYHEGRIQDGRFYLRNNGKANDVSIYLNQAFLDWVEYKTQVDPVWGYRNLFFVMKEWSEYGDEDEDEASEAETDEAE